jgi:hypothetical protein
MSKGDNLGGGLPEGLFEDIIGQVVTGPKGKGTPEEQAAVLLALAQEENAALHPGNGTTSMVDAMLKYVAIAQAAQALADAPNGVPRTAAQTAAQTAAINNLVPAIQALGKLWGDFGPVGAGFLDSAKAKP